MREYHDETSNFIFGETEDIERIYRSFWKHSSYNPTHSNRAKFVKGRIYGLEINHATRTFVVLSENTVCALLLYWNLREVRR